MIIINATMVPKTIMTDKSELITILPGGESKLMIASKNLITAAIKLGTPSEIGIVLGGGYELDVAKSVTASIPYLYTSVEEAKSKLIDPSIDYKAKLTVKKDTLQLQEELKAKENLVQQLQEKIDQLEQVKANSVSISKLNEMETTIADLEKSNRELTGDKARLVDQVKDLQEQIRQDADSINKLREENGLRTQELSTNTKLISDLNEKMDRLKAEYNKLVEESSKPEDTKFDPTETDEYKRIASELELAKSNAEAMKSDIQDLRQNLEEAVNKIEAMKSTFNAACEKFHLYLDDDGEWQQETEAVSDEGDAASE